MDTSLDTPWSENLSQTDITDEMLCMRAADGDLQALETLVRRHQRWIYNVCLRLVLSPVDAEDLAQEVLIRIITRMSQFRAESMFRTWAYRIVINHFLNSKRGKMEQAITTFGAYGEELDALPLAELEPSSMYATEKALLVEEAKVGCMLGMLLCLSREQRVVYILGEIFEAPGPIASEILDIQPATFRKRLERARADLTNFMNEKCGLINEQNPCRCERKTKAFIKEGWVDPKKLKFTAKHVDRLRQQSPTHARQLDTLHEQHYARLFREHPIHKGPDLAAILHTLLQDPRLRSTFSLDV